MAYLIVDDVSIMRLVLKDILVRYCGCASEEIYEADRGKAALEKYGEIKPKVVFCDVSMPEMDGVAVVKKIIETDPEAKIIMCTASAEKEMVQQCISAGAIDYIVKPPVPERVRQAFEKCVNGGQ